MHRLIAAALVCFVAPSAQAQAQARPLPDPHTFLQAARKHLETDDERQSGYSYVYSASARVALVKVMRRAGTSEFSSYKKFSVDTSATYAPPKRPNP